VVGVSVAVEVAAVGSAVSAVAEDLAAAAPADLGDNGANDTR
jgi:hypothetical protein